MERLDAPVALLLFLEIARCGISRLASVAIVFVLTRTGFRSSSIGIRLVARMRCDCQTLLAPEFRQPVDELAKRRIVVDRSIHRYLFDLFSDASRAGILADGSHHVRGLNAMHLVFVEEDNRRHFQFTHHAIFQFTIAVLFRIEVVILRTRLLETEHPVWIKIDEKRLRLHVELDFTPLLVRHRTDETALQTKYRLVIFLRSGRVLQKEHCVPLGDRAAGQHAIYRERNRLDAFAFTLGNRADDIGNLDESVLDLLAGNVYDLVLAKFSKRPLVLSVSAVKQGFKRIT